MSVSRSASIQFTGNLSPGYLVCTAASRLYRRRAADSRLRTGSSKAISRTVAAMTETTAPPAICSHGETSNGTRFTTLVVNRKTGTWMI